MEAYNTDVRRSLKWMQNNAPNLTGLVNKKADWVTQYHTKFWEDWTKNIFDLRSANSFGLMIWCIILGAPSDQFGLYPDNASWAYGAQRQNYIDSGGHLTLNFNGTPQFFIKNPSGDGFIPLDSFMPFTFDPVSNSITFPASPSQTGVALYWSGVINPPNSGAPTVVSHRLFGLTGIATNYSLLPVPLTDYNEQGGNFYGGNQTSLLNLAEVRQALQLRYAHIVCNGRISFINRMLAVIFNDGKPWDVSSGKYFYLMDLTGAVDSTTTPYYMEYRIGPNLDISPQFINLMNSPQFGIMPVCAGIAYKVVKE